MALMESSRKRRRACTLCSVLSGMMFGMTAAFLRFRGLIAFSPVFLWTLLIASSAYLAVLAAAWGFANHGGDRKRGGTVANALLVGVAGTVLFSALLLGLGCAASTGLSAVLGGLLIAFFSLSVTNTICLIRIRLKL